MLYNSNEMKNLSILLSLLVMGCDYCDDTLTRHLSSREKLIFCDSLHEANAKTRRYSNKLEIELDAMKQQKNAVRTDVLHLKMDSITSVTEKGLAIHSCNCQ